MGTIRKIQAGVDPLNSAAVVNRPHEDTLSISGLTTDGLNFPGFAQKMGTIVLTHNRASFVGDGVNDDGVALAAADGIAVSANGTHILDLNQGTSKIYVNSNVTLTAPFRPVTGARRIYVASGKTLTINGDFDPAKLTGVFDHTSPGMIVFGKQRVFSPYWFGFVGDGVTDDAPALTWMGNTVIPDYARVVFSAACTSILKSTWERVARRGITWESEFTPFPDGKATAFLWRGPGYVTGADLVMNGTTTVTSATGLFTPAMQGQWLLVKYNTSGPNSRVLSKIAAYVSPTQVTLTDVPVDSNNNPVSGTALPFSVGGIMAVDIACDHCATRGFVWWLTEFSTAQQFFDGYISAGSAVLHGASAPGFMLSVNTSANRGIRVAGAGPNGTDLISTVKSYDANNQITLNNNASTTIPSNVLTRYDFGEANQSCLPALYGLITDKTGYAGINGPSTGTKCTYERNLIHCQLQGPWFGLAISPTAYSNQEYMQVRQNIFFGGGNSYQHFYAGAATTATSTAITAAVGGTFTQQMVGQRLRVPNAGGTGITLNTKIIFVTDSTHATMKDAAVAPVSGARIIVGENLSTGIEVGSSFNAKRQYLFDNNFSLMKYGLSQLSGSVALDLNNYTLNECNWNAQGSSEACLESRPNTEGSLRHLINNIELIPVTVKGGRLDNQFAIPNGGYINTGSTGTLTIIEGTNFDLLPTTNDSQLYECPGGGMLVLRNNNYQNPTTMAQAFGDLNQWYNFGGIIDADGEGQIVDAPAGGSFLLGDMPKGGSLVELHSSGSITPAVAGRIFQRGDSGSADITALRGQFEKVAGAMPSGFRRVATEGAVGSVNPDFRAGETVAVLARLCAASGALNDAGLPLYGFLATSPNAPNTLHEVYGSRLLPMKVAGVITGHGYYAEGPSDDSWFAGGIAVGSPNTGGALPLPTNTLITNIEVYTPSLTPVSVAASTIAEQTFTVTGLTTADKVLVNPPAIANSTGIAGARVSAANTLAIRFSNSTTGALIPSSGTYTVIAIRS